MFKQSVNQSTKNFIVSKPILLISEADGQPKPRSQIPSESDPDEFGKSNKQKLKSTIAIKKRILIEMEYPFS